MKYFYAILSALLFVACKSKENTSPADDGMDPDIVLVNIEKGDRAFIGSLIKAVDSCQPAVIAIDAWFVASKGVEEDSVLRDALKSTNKDIVAYMIDPDMGVRKSHPKFRSFMTAEGVAVFEGGVEGITLKPILVFNKEKHISLELRIIEMWKPDFNYSFKPDESIPVRMLRQLDQYKHFDMQSLRAHRDELKNKVVILSYLGPDNEDKHFTPLRKRKSYPQGEPDTYGAVIIANGIRSMLEYDKKE